MKLYIVNMLRFGDIETHHYIVGVFDSKDEAEKVGLVEEYWRGGKYKARIEEFTLNELEPNFEEKLKYSGLK